MKVPDIFVPEKDLGGSIRKLLEESQKPIVAVSESGKFEIIFSDNYAEGIAKLKEQGQKPFTFAENVAARVACYQGSVENAGLFKTWLDSVTGIAYKAKSKEFKMVLRSNRLENITPYSSPSLIFINYGTEKGIEFDIREGKYNKPLTRKEAKNHEFWLAILGGNKELLEKYVDIWFDRARAKKGMGVYLRSDTDKDVLRALVLGSDCNYSNLTLNSGYDNLGSARFLLGAQRK